MLHGAIWWPLLLSTFAGLSTTIGAVIAISRTPDEATLAFLLGSAIGVMATVSGAELWWHKAVQQENWFGITAAVAAGAITFAVLDPLLPKPPEPQQLLYEADEKQVEPHAVVHLDSEPEVTVATAVKRQGFAPRQQAASGTAKQLPLGSSGSASSIASSPRHSTAPRSTGSTGLFCGSEDQLLLPRTTSSSLHEPVRKLPGIALEMQTAEAFTSISDMQQQGPLSVHGASSGGSSNSSSLAALRAHHSGLMRLGLLMAVTMSLHNLPEGCAVAFSAFTDFGVMMAVAIAVHNIPEGLIIAVPIYAATNSKARAIGIAAASGLSEPLGALAALFVFRPFVTSLEQLDYVLAFVGGVMLAVCGLELWPEGRKCRQDVKMMQGILLGSVVMGWTLYVGV